jgi:predicted acetyltransferase
MEIKKIPNERIIEFVNIANNAYPAFAVYSDEEKQQSASGYTELQDEHPFADLYGLYKENQLQGGMILYDYKMNVLNQRVPAGGVGMVAVDLLHKKEKVAKELITYYLNHFKNKGTNLAILYPFRPDFYKKMGFGYGTKMSQYTIKPASFPKGNSKSHIQYLTSEDVNEITACYNRVVDNSHGMIEMYDWEFKRIIKNPKLKIIGYKSDGRIEGFITFTFKQYPNDNAVTNDIHIHRFVYENTNALMELLTFLNSQQDQIRHVIINTQDDTFHHLLLDPRNNTNHMIPSVYHESNTQGVGLMYRVIDVSRFFEDLKDYNFNDVSIKLKLTIQDSFLETNNGATIMHINEGKCTVMNDSENYDVELSLDISDFSSLIMGVVSFKQLFNYGLVFLSDDRFVNQINKLFFVENKPVCTTAF